MAAYFSGIISMVLGAPYTVYISLGIAIVFLIGGIVLYRKRHSIKALKGTRWPGALCALLGCASLATTAIQYIV